MVKIEKIHNGYLIHFKNTENVRIKLYFSTLDSIHDWLKLQFEPIKEQK